MTVSTMFDLSTKHAVVTGGAQGLGFTIAKSLAAFGCDIAIVDIDAEAAAKAAQEMATTYSVNTRSIQADVSKEEEVSAMVDSVLESFPQIDVLVNNAGIVKKIDTLDMTYSDWKRTMDVNINALFLTSKQVGKHMVANGSGSIMNMSSMSAMIANREAQSAYNASKGAVSMLTKSLASEWAQYGIRVNAIAPGYMASQMTGPLFAPGGELEHILDHVPMKRLGRPDELSGIAVYLASDASSFTTGSIIVVDGGYTTW
ncbi:SDR family oxidoreductase [Shouchella clausii]|uniref:SDR family NAD(P)-dependent oxidoreductase n=1 Tax=Shouchella clausii TaxID=79880 RepID=UPI0039831C99